MGEITTDSILAEIRSKCNSNGKKIQRLRFENVHEAKQNRVSKKEKKEGIQCESDLFN
jgi:hypothetical protein